MAKKEKSFNPARGLFQNHAQEVDTQGLNNSIAQVNDTIEQHNNIAQENNTVDTHNNDTQEPQTAIKTEEPKQTAQAGQNAAGEPQETAQPVEGELDKKFQKYAKKHHLAPPQIERDSLKGTQGKKGHKLPRINMAFTPDNYDFILWLSEKRNISMTEVVNELIEKERK